MRPDSVAPSTNATPVPLTYHAGWLPKVKKAVPVSDRVLRSHMANKLVAKLSFLIELSWPTCSFPDLARASRRVRE